jgi:tRNA threonylcarbamoyladenosine biosynthesis protein TsaB
MILSIETATDKSSVAVHDKGRLLGLVELHLTNSHSGSLTVIIDQLLKNCQLSNTEISAIAVSEGPGSYTGLRIGISTAKGLCYALGKPLIAVNTLDAMAEQVIENYAYSANKNLLFCPMIDARRMEVYSAMYNIDKQRCLAPKPIIIEHDAFKEFTDENEILIFGNGAAKCTKVLPSKVFKLIEGVYPSAKYIGKLAYAKYLEAHFADVAYLEPYYLKAYQAKLPKKNKLFK